MCSASIFRKVYELRVYIKIQLWHNLNCGDSALLTCPSKNKSNDFICLRYAPSAHQTFHCYCSPLSNALKIMVRPAGIEPATLSLEG